MADPARARKVAERIKVLMAEGLSTLVKDPRLGFVTITDVRVTGDLQQATVFYTVLGGDQERADAAEVLQTYRGRLRSHMGRGLGIRLTPTLEFVPDALPEDAAHLEDLLRQVHERDAELAAQATAAGYAGEPDPYRKPRPADQPGDGPGGPSGETEADPHQPGDGPGGPSGETEADTHQPGDGPDDPSAETEADSDRYADGRP